jgi:hypothetical protein
MKIIRASVLFALLLPAITWAQRRPIDPREHTRFANREAQLQVSITTDRKVYFAGETYSIELSVVNPTPNTLEVRDPFDSNSAAIDMQKKANPQNISEREAAQGGWAWMNAHLKADRLPQPEANVVLQGSSQKSTCVLKGRDTLPGDPARVYAYSVPHDIGDYRFLYAYGRGAQAEFSVIPMKVDTFADIVLQRRSGPVKNILGTSSTRPLYYSALALDGDGSHWLFISTRITRSTSELEVQNGSVMARDVGSVAPIIRIAKSNAPIGSIFGIADAKDNLTITWTDSNGQTSTIKLDQDKKDSWGLGSAP